MESVEQFSVVKLESCPYHELKEYVKDDNSVGLDMLRLVNSNIKSLEEQNINFETFAKEKVLQEIDTFVCKEDALRAFPKDWRESDLQTLVVRVYASDLYS